MKGVINVMVKCTIFASKNVAEKGNTQLPVLIVELLLRSEDACEFSISPVFCPCSACLNEMWSPKKKGDQAAIAEDKKKKKKKKKGSKKGKSVAGEDGTSAGEKAKKKEKKVKRKKKSKAPVEKSDREVSSDEDIQPEVPLPGQKTEL